METPSQELSHSSKGFGQMHMGPTFPERGDKPSTLMHIDSIEPGAQGSPRGPKESLAS